MVKPVKPGAVVDKEIELLYDIFYNIINYFKKEKKKKRIVYKNKQAVDILPLESKTYSSAEFTYSEFESFNEAVDEYFGKGVVKVGLDRGEEKYNRELKRLMGIEAKQKETIEKLNAETVKCREVGNLIYQNLDTIEGLIAEVRKKRKTMSDDEIVEKINGVKNVKGNELELEL